MLDELSRAGGAGDKRLSNAAARCNVPYDRFRDYVADLQRRGLLRPEDPFELTPKGRELLATYRAWRESLRLFGLADAE